MLHGNVSLPPSVLMALPSSWYYCYCSTHRRHDPGLICAMYIFSRSWGSTMTPSLEDRMVSATRTSMNIATSVVSIWFYAQYSPDTVKASGKYDDNASGSYIGRSARYSETPWYVQTLEVFPFSVCTENQDIIFFCPCRCQSINAAPLYSCNAVPLFYLKRMRLHVFACPQLFGARTYRTEWVLHVCCIF